jgi:hypothetical protein
MTNTHTGMRPEWGENRQTLQRVTVYVSRGAAAARLRHCCSPQLREPQAGMLLPLLR